MSVIASQECFSLFIEEENWSGTTVRCYMNPSRLQNERVFYFQYVMAQDSVPTT